MQTMLCPRCEQDEVLEVRVRRTGTRLYVCPECEATWLCEGSISEDAFLDFGAYMEGLGMSPLWDELDFQKPPRSD